MGERKTGTEKQRQKDEQEREGREECWEVVVWVQSNGKLRSSRTGDPAARIQPRTQHEAQLGADSVFS